MNTIYLIIVTLFACFFVKAQQSVLISNTWNLEKVTLNNVEHYFPNSIPTITATSNFDSIASNHFKSAICNNLEANVTYNNNQISFILSSLTLGSCPNSNNNEYNIFEGYYFEEFFVNFIAYGTPALYGYLIEPIGNSLKLTLTNPIGDTAVYWASNLSASNLSLSDFKIYPNPVKSVLNISAKLPELNVQLYDMQGKLILSKNIKRKSASDIFGLDMNSIKKGNYILSINNPNGELIHTSKILIKTEE